MNCLFPILAFTVTACAPRSTKNDYNGANEQYVCTSSIGRIELKLAPAPLPQCVKLSDLPPEDAQLIVDAAAAEAAKPTPKPDDKGTILIDMTKI